jgi:hypothetical protein
MIENPPAEIDINALEQRRQARAREVHIQGVGAPSVMAAGVQVLAEAMENFAIAPYSGSTVQKESEYRATKINALRTHWNAPKRQVANRSLDKSGRWGEKLNTVLSRLGSGFMIGLVNVRGAGKTQIGVEAMLQVTSNLKTARYCTATDFFVAIKASFKDKTETEASVIAEYRKPSLLVVDEVSKRGQTDWEDRLLFDLLDKRYQDMKDTILIANVTVGEFEAAVGPSLASRIKETGGVINCDWESFRK